MYGCACVRSACNEKVYIYIYIYIDIENEREGRGRREGESRSSSDVARLYLKSRTSLREDGVNEPLRFFYL